LELFTCCYQQKNIPIYSKTAFAFSVSKSDVDRTCKYILNQAEHHKKVSFSEELEIFIKHYQETIRKKFD